MVDLKKPQKAKKTKKQRKYGRNAKFCLRYKLSDRRGINKCKKLYRVLRYNPNDTMAAAYIAASMHDKKARQELREVGWQGEFHATV